MRIIHVAAECSHIIKAGGLGDVVYGLAKNQSKKHHVEVILPKYDTIDYKNLPNLRVSLRDLWSYQDGLQVHNSVWSDKLDGIHISLIEPHHKDYYFCRGQIYGQKDDCTRFLYFCRTLFELLSLHRKNIDVLHLHDWQTAGLALMLKTFCQKEFRVPRIVYTIHNMRHQGVCLPSDLMRIGIRAQDLLNQDSLQDPIKLDCINLAKGAIQCSDSITTVSKTYAQEIQTKKEGYSLHDAIIKRNSNLFGIVNGIDYDQYNPKKDNALFQQFCPETDPIEKVLLAKSANKEHLLHKLNLPLDLKKPLIVSITRIDEQKGLEFFKEAIKLASQEKHFTYILLGSTTTLAQKVEFEALQKKLSCSCNVHMHLTFNQKLAHLMYAAADLILIPSISEPCGLTQMIAMRYGTIPIAHATGGLKDTIDSNTGFLYKKPTLNDFKQALTFALDLYNNSPKKFQELQQSALTKDFSFKNIGAAYEEVYKSTKKSSTLDHIPIN